MTKLIGEIGINHNGDFKIAKELCDHLCKIGVWGIKFQYRNIKDYKKYLMESDEIGKEIIDKEVIKNYLSPSEIIKLTKYIRKKKVKVGISFFLSKDVTDFKNFNFDFYKIPSAVCDNLSLIKTLKKKKKLIIISLGAKDHNEITDLKKNYNKILKQKYTVLHCISNYPLSPNNSNLIYIENLKKIFKGNYVGYSSHDKEIYMPILSLSKKIEFLERHVTLDKKMKGLDHSSSSNLEEIKKLNYFCQNINELIFNKKKRKKNQGEIINLQNLGIGYYSNKKLTKGSIIKSNDIIEVYGKNLGLRYADIINKKLVRSIPKNKLFEISCFEHLVKINQKDNFFLNKKNISLPVRPKDYLEIDEIFKLENYEFHMSFNDLKNVQKNEIDKSFLENKRFSVHAPDYCDENNIIDIFNENKIVVQKSKNVLNLAINFAKYLQKITKKQTLLVCSFSQLNRTMKKENFYRKLNNYINSVKKKSGVQIIPQWLPSFAWYFGGTEKIEVFSNPDDLKIINKLKMKICMDISHFILSCNYHKKDIEKNFQKYIKIFNHFHLSDASGIDFEGIPLGSGYLKKSKILKNIFNRNDKTKVIETWQGHLNGYKLFKDDINYIKNYFNEK